MLPARSTWIEIKIRRRTDAAVEPALEFGNAFEHLLDGLAHDEFLSREKGDDGVGRVLDELDEISVDNQRLVVQASEIDHP